MNWPAAYHQPDPKRDCHFYATAYVCRALGFPDTTADAVRAFRDAPYGEAGRYLSEAHYPEMECGLEIQPYWRDMDANRDFDDRWWLGPSQRAWVEQMLADGWIARADVMRVREMAHAVVLLESRGDAGVLLMDPWAGLVVESWAWFLRRGPRHEPHEVHRIEAWYRRPSPCN